MLYPDSYTTEVYANLYLADGFPENVYLKDLHERDVTSDTSIAFNLPQMIAVHGYLDPRVTSAGLDATPMASTKGFTVDVNRDQWDEVRLAAPDGSYTFWLQLKVPYPESYARYERPILRLATDWTPDIAVPEMPPFRTISGQVLDPKGAPIENVAVVVGSVVPTTPQAGWNFGCETVTDANGRYALHIPNGKYTAYVDTGVSYQPSETLIP